MINLTHSCIKTHFYKSKESLITKKFTLFYETPLPPTNIILQLSNLPSQGWKYPYLFNTITFYPCIVYFKIILFVYIFHTILYSMFNLKYLQFIVVIYITFMHLKLYLTPYVRKRRLLSSSNVFITYIK